MAQVTLKARKRDGLKELLNHPNKAKKSQGRAVFSRYAPRTDTKRVQRTIQGCNEVFKEQRLNFSEGLEVMKRIIVNIFDNKAQEVGTIEELQAVFDIAEDFLTTLIKKVVNAIQGK